MGFHSQAFRFASQLLQPENRPRVDAKYKRKVEQIVRRGAREDDPSVAEDPLLCVALGTGHAVENIDRLRGVLSSMY